MALEWYEWECPHCHRIGQVDPEMRYEDGETMDMNCPCCNGEVAVFCYYQPMFFAYKPENSRGESE